MTIPFVEQHLSYILGVQDRRLVAQQVEKGYIIRIEETGKHPMELHKQRGGVRVFKTLDSVSSLVSLTKVTTYSVRLLPKKGITASSASPSVTETPEEDIPF